jgi:hypothetical protein
MTLCGRVVCGMDGTQVRNLLLFSTVFAVVGGLPILTDRIGPKRTLAGVIQLCLLPYCVARHARRALAARNDRGVLRVLHVDREGLNRRRASAYSGDALHLRDGAVGYRISIGSPS